MELRQNNMKKKVKITPEMMKIFHYVRYHKYLKKYRAKKKFSTIKLAK